MANGPPEDIRRPGRSWRALAHAFDLLSGGRCQPKWTRLACHPLLAGYHVSVLRRVAAVADEATVSAGHILGKQGRPAEWFFLIHSGQAELVRDGTRLGVLGPGEHFGEVALLGRGPHPVSARALTSMTLFVIGAQRFLPLVQDIRRLRHDMDAALLRQVHLVEMARHERTLRLRLPLDMCAHPVSTAGASSVSLRTAVNPSRDAAAGGGLPYRWRAALAGAMVTVLGPIAATAILYHPPFLVIAPGPAVDLSRDITISGVSVHRPRGHYLMLTTQTQRPNLLGLGLALLHLDRQVLPADRLSPASPQAGALQRKLRAEFARSRIQAAAAATRAAGMTVTATDQLPFTIHFRNRNVVGPSAGLIYALAIEDMLSATDRAHGRIIAATGEIDPMGVVTAVGDVSEKAAAARHARAQLLLVPESNLGSMSDNSVPVDGVASLDDALTDVARSQG